MQLRIVQSTMEIQLAAGDLKSPFPVSLTETYDLYTAVYDWLC